MAMLKIATVIALFAVADAMQSDAHIAMANLQKQASMLRSAQGQEMLKVGEQTLLKLQDDLEAAKKAEREASAKYDASKDDTAQEETLSKDVAVKKNAVLMAQSGFEVMQERVL